MRRSSTFIAAVAVAALALTPSLADARVGGGSSSGSRGSRTYTAPPSTNTAPTQAAPMERTTTARPGPSAPSGPMASPAMGGGRSMFGSALMGGLLGVGIGSLLFGGGLFGGGGLGMLGFISLLVQGALIFFVVRWLVRMYMRRRQPAMAGGPDMGRQDLGRQDLGRNEFARTQQLGQGAMAGGGAAARPATAPVTVGKDDFASFERLLRDVQAAWSNQDLNGLRALATPEMVGYFNDQLTEQSRRGVRNTVTDVKLEQGDLSEAWAERNQEYATVAMRFSMLDTTRDSAGRVVDGDVATRTMATELWTFVRSSGCPWVLSAIQQTR